ncbi:echinoderm microtubule-associated protein-like CG42247 [Drosophila obscura]|uniref:echinoderm microtubule-associated protein-like CG42247 n=1 Tax=Drosophila obscura TaxID=7282 RepID=UPI001BB19E14|nr:echinoderm microtubule-associated protein-like CG42247 [Drosophila obscura]
MNEENDDYLAHEAAAMADEERDVDGVDGDLDGDGDGHGRSVAAANNESVLGGQTMPQISSNAQLEGNVSPTPIPTQTTASHFDDNLQNNNISNKHSGNINNNHSSGGNHQQNDSNHSSPVKSPKRNISSSFRIQNAPYDEDEDEDLTAGDLQPDIAGASAAAAGT